MSEDIKNDWERWHKTEEYRLGNAAGFDDHWTQTAETACPKHYDEDQRKRFIAGFHQGALDEILSGAV